MSITMARLDEILESFNSHDVDRIVANFDENGEFLMAAGPEQYGERFVGRKAIGEALRQRFQQFRIYDGWMQRRRFLMIER